MQTVTCPRCNGDKVIDAYRHINNGICALCDGTGTRTRKTTASSKPRTRKVAVGANAELWAEFTAAHPAEAAVINAGKADEYSDLAYAFSAVATYRRGDSNSVAALDIARRHLAA